MQNAVVKLAGRIYPSLVRACRTVVKLTVRVELVLLIAVLERLELGGCRGRADRIGERCGPAHRDLDLRHDLAVIRRDDQPAVADLQGHMAVAEVIGYVMRMRGELPPLQPGQKPQDKLP